MNEYYDWWEFVMITLPEEEIEQKKPSAPHTLQSRYAMHMRSVYGTIDATIPDIDISELEEMTIPLREIAQYGRSIPRLEAKIEKGELYKVKLDPKNEFIVTQETDLRYLLKRNRKIAKEFEPQVITQTKALAKYLGLEDNVETNGIVDIGYVSKVIKTANWLLRNLPKQEKPIEAIEGITDLNPNTNRSYCF